MFRAGHNQSRGHIRETCQAPGSTAPRPPFGRRDKACEGCGCAHLCGLSSGLRRYICSWSSVFAFRGDWVDENQPLAHAECGGSKGKGSDVACNIFGGTAKGEAGFRLRKFVGEPKPLGAVPCPRGGGALRHEGERRIRRVRRARFGYWGT